MSRFRRIPIEADAKRIDETFWWIEYVDYNGCHFQHTIHENDLRKAYQPLDSQGNPMTWEQYDKEHDDQRKENCNSH